MKMKFDVIFHDGTDGAIEIEKPPGAHPESQLTIATAFLQADNADRVAASIRRSGYTEWITRKDSAGAILTEIERRYPPAA